MVIFQDRLIIVTDGDRVLHFSQKHIIDTRVFVVVHAGSRQHGRDF
jgi:hypothetical protein